MNPPYLGTALSFGSPAEVSFGQATGLLVAKALLVTLLIGQSPPPEGEDNLIRRGLIG